jgi:hypothetical protein
MQGLEPRGPRHSHAKFAVLLPFYRFFDLRLSLLYLLFYLRASPLYRFLCLVLYPLNLLVHLLLYLLLHSPTRGCAEHRKESDHEENAESCSHPSPYLPVERVYEGYSDAIRIRHERGRCPRELTSEFANQGGSLPSNMALPFKEAGS